VERALSILCELAKVDTPLGISDLSRRTGCSKSTVYLSLQTMRAMNFVVQDPGTERYGLGLAAAQLGGAARDNSRLVTALADPMSELAARSSEAVSLGVRTGDEVLFVKRFETSHALGTSIREGTRMPMHTSAAGKAILMGLTDEALLTMFPDESLPVQGSNFVGSRTDLLNQLATAREVGYTTSEDEWRAGVSAAAVPIVIGGEVVASVSIAGPTSRFRASLWVDDLLALAHPLHKPRTGDTHDAKDER
jgi:DNA-binding IclR family transcriptional regulator